MSFYFDDDDDFYPSQGSAPIKKETGGDDFICDNCGGTESYMDETTGNLTCTECFTQSQNIVAASQMEMEMEDALGLAGRNRGGRLTALHKRQRKRKRPENTIKKLEEYDTSVALPTLSECLTGIQRILKECSRIICDLAVTEDHERVFDTVKAMWKAYLLSWHEGAEYYGAIYPEVRLCFRDQFLSTIQTMRLNKTLYYLTSKRLQEKIIKEETAKNKGEDEPKDDAPPQEDFVFMMDNQDDDGSHGDDDDAFESSEKIGTSIGSTYRDLNTISQMIYSHSKQARDHKNKNRAPKTKFNCAILVGRKEVALMLAPSMLMVSAILLQATAHLGVTSTHMRRWILNGSLPLLNACKLLKKKELRALKHITPFFRMKTVLPLSSFDKMVANLHVACGFKPRSIKVRRKKNNRLHAVSDVTKAWKPGDLILPSHVPILASRFVSELGLSQKVLNFSLALMGLPLIEAKVPKERPGGEAVEATRRGKEALEDSDEPSDSELVLLQAKKNFPTPSPAETRKNDGEGREQLDPELWLPPPLKKARCDKLLDHAKILAVILVACKMIPDWDEGLSFDEPFASNKNRQEKTSSQSLSISQEEITFGRDAKRLNTEREKKRFVPSKPGHFRCLKNGQSVTDYLDFIEENIVNTNDATMPEFVNLLEGQHRETVARIPTAKPSFLIENTILTCRKDSNEVRMLCDTREMKHTEFKYQLTEKLRGASSFAFQMNPPLGPLIEYMAYKTNTKPMAILDFVSSLDLEIAEKHCREQMKGKSAMCFL